MVGFRINIHLNCDGVVQKVAEDLLLTETTKRGNIMGYHGLKPETNNVIAGFVHTWTILPWHVHQAMRNMITTMEWSGMVYFIFSWLVTVEDDLFESTLKFQWFVCHCSLGFHHFTIASAGKQAFLMLLHPLGNCHNQIGWKKEEAWPRAKHIFSCKMHSIRTMVVIRFRMWQIPRINSTLEENTGYVSTLKH